MQNESMDRLHVVIDRAASVAAEPFFAEAERTEDADVRKACERLARRVDRTVRLASYEYLNGIELI